MRPHVSLLALLAAAPTLAQPLAISSPNPETRGNFGRPVAGVPDADGDGRGDLLVGEVGEGTGGRRVYLYSGASGALLHTLTSPDPEYFGYFGLTVSGVEDANGDGRGDLLVGSNEARAYLFSGASGALLRTLTSPDPEPFGFFGGAVAGVQDVDGDGRGDLLVGAQREAEVGRAYVFSGATGALLHELNSPGGGTFGSVVSGAPDADGDGRGDLLVSADPDFIGLPAGWVYLFSGATGTLLHAFESSNPDFTDRFGGSVSGVPDANGDGRGDILIGAWGETVGREGDADAGRAYVFSGATGKLLHTLESPRPVRGGNFGISVAGLSDVDGDGQGDLGVGASGENDFAGRAYVFSGATGRRLYAVRSPDLGARGAFGHAVAGLPDVNGDGRGDGVVGAPYEDVTVGGTTSLFAGRAYLYRTRGADGAWVGEEVIAAGEPSPETPAALALVVGPNPLTTATTLRVSLPHPSDVTVEALDVLGRRVALLHEGALGAGSNELQWAPASGLSAGVYLLRLHVEGAPSVTCRLTLTR